ncbi:SDR family oxidoreductase [Streptomyces sp. SL13]|uniref:SDR family oxidoreductase n=1 Tax=Streptantibioticus silvisoli TaxID=2705255 RepID=A0AA90KFF8_9ACTN|nr:SDR family oxidoreductase [Streptantibioticus silvisoli]MDI5962594.1 SDR family oxidoreductase [Streptantibioticus silvisoli]MDI5969225.1 SDR family oxidoreductase [Streptantibioticus silvisoli]
MDLGLAGRVYLVTGGTSGLGRATAEALVAEGARVVVSSRDPQKVANTAAELGENAIGVPVDNADPDAAARLTDAALTAFGRIDGALISVGGPPAGTATTIADEVWRQQFDAIFLGALRIVRHLAPLLDVATGREDGGAIALVLSSSVKTPIPGLSVSNGLRAGLAMMTKDLADELGPQGTRVLTVVPGRILTARTVELEGGDPRARERSEATIPLRRLGRPEEYGRIAAVMLSPVASYVTGSIIPVDGGMLRSL